MTLWTPLSDLEGEGEEEQLSLSLKIKWRGSTSLHGCEEVIIDDIEIYFSKFSYLS